MLDFSIREYFDYLIKKSTKEIDAELKSLGWTKSSSYKRRVTLSETTFEDIRKLFGLDDDAEIKQLDNLSMSVD